MFVSCGASNSADYRIPLEAEVATYGLVSPALPPTFPQQRIETGGHDVQGRVPHRDSIARTRT